MKHELGILDIQLLSILAEVPTSSVNTGFLFERFKARGGVTEKNTSRRSLCDLARRIECSLEKLHGADCITASNIDNNWMAAELLDRGTQGVFQITDLGTQILQKVLQLIENPDPFAELCEKCAMRDSQIAAQDARRAARAGLRERFVKCFRSIFAPGG